MDKIFAQFPKEKEYLSGLSPRTIKYFKQTFDVWKKRIGAMPDKQNIKEFVIQLQQSGISPSTTNSYIRGMNSFFTWLHENEHTPERLRIKKLKAPRTVVKTFSDSQLGRLLSYKPKTFCQRRFFTMLCLAVDTGCRVDELLSLRRDAVDMDNLLITVVGKGNKERIVPISIELRKVLWKFLKTHQFDLVFPTRHGTKVSYRNVLDQLKDVGKELGITGVRLSWHTLRHTFATSYLRDGGNVIYLSRILGHSDLSTTQIYVQNSTEDLALMHRKTSLLARLH